MLSIADLDALAAARLDDATALLHAGRADGAIYLAGYAVEIQLKARICRTLKWSGFPAKSSEFQTLTSFKTHSLDLLLRLSGREPPVKKNQFKNWNAVAIWNPEARYLPIGQASIADAKKMLKAVKTLLKAL